MRERKQLRILTMTALLSGMAILLPLMMPIKLIIPPASYTLASHVPIFLALFMSPSMARFVTLAAAVGFFVSGMPLIIVYRALSHILFVMVGSWYLSTHPHILQSGKGRIFFNLALAFIHSMGEVLAVLLFFGGDLWTVPHVTYTFGVLIGLGTIVHSIIDFLLALVIYRLIPHQFIVSGYKDPVKV